MQVAVWFGIAAAVVGVIRLITWLISLARPAEPDRVSNSWLKERWFEESIRERRM